MAADTFSGTKVDVVLSGQLIFTLRVVEDQSHAVMDKRDGGIRWIRLRRFS
jgi:hypothetical protein